MVSQGTLFRLGTMTEEYWQVDWHFVFYKHRAQVLSCKQTKWRFEKQNGRKITTFTKFQGLLKQSIIIIEKESVELEDFFSIPTNLCKRNKSPSIRSGIPTFQPFPLLFPVLSGLFWPISVYFPALFHAFFVPFPSFFRHFSGLFSSLIWPHFRSHFPPCVLLSAQNPVPFPVMHSSFR